MEQLSLAEMTKRLGQEPEPRTFLDQCYDAGEGNKGVGAVTRKNADRFIHLGLSRRHLCSLERGAGESIQGHDDIAEQRTA
jgi:hypothetical protein